MPTKHIEDNGPNIDDLAADIHALLAAHYPACVYPRITGDEPSELRGGGRHIEVVVTARASRWLHPDDAGKPPEAQRHAMNYDDLVKPLVDEEVDGPGPYVLPAARRARLLIQRNAAKAGGQPDWVPGAQSILVPLSK